MPSKIWYELSNAKMGEIYLTKYLEIQKLIKKTLQITTIIFSMAGILKWKYFEDYVWVAFILIAIIQVFMLINSQIVRSDEEIGEIANLRMMYTRYFNKLEMLWDKHQNDQINQKKALEQYFILKQSDFEKIEELSLKLNINNIAFIREKSERETLIHLKHYFNA